MRGLVVLLLIPDLSGGFAFHAMAEREPGHPLWRALGTQFTHAAWTGATVWDLVMPAFIFLVGVSLGLSYAARRAAGASEGQFIAHAAVRSAALVLLGLLLARGINNTVDELLPFLVLALGLPIGRWASRLPLLLHGSARLIEFAFVAFVLLLALGWITTQTPRHEGYEANNVLLLIGLAYLPAATLQRWPIRAQAWAAFAVLTAYGLAFHAYAPPAHLVPVGEVLQGWQAHWNNGTNVAVALDRWLLNLLPDRPPYVDNPHGYHTLQFVPLVSVILLGAIVGRSAAARGSLRSLVTPMVGASVGALALSWLLAATAVPLVKSLWTPSWALFSTAIAALMLAACSLLFDAEARRAAAAPLVVLGNNALLLYVLSHNERWRLVQLGNRLFPDAASLPWHPVLESLFVLAVLWGVSATLHRLRLYVRL